MKRKEIIATIFVLVSVLSVSAQVGAKERKALWESHIINIIEGNKEAVVASAEDDLDFAAYFDDEVCAMFGKTSVEQITDLVTENGQTLLVVVSEPYTRTSFAEDENPEMGGKQKYVTVVTYRMDGANFKLLRVHRTFLGGDEEYRKNITAAVGVFELEDTRMSQLRKIIGYMRDGDVRNIKASSFMQDANWIEIGERVLPDVNVKKLGVDETIKLIFALLHDGIEQFYSKRKLSRMYPRLDYSGRPLAEEEGMYAEFQEQEHYSIGKEIKTITKVGGIDYYIRVRMTFSINSKERGLELVGIDGQPQEPMADREAEEINRNPEYAAQEEEMGGYGEEMMEEPEFRIKENETDREKVWNTLIKSFQEKEITTSAAHFPLEWTVDFVNRDLNGFHYGDEGEEIPFLSSEEYNLEMTTFLNCGVADHLATLSPEDLDFGNWALLSELSAGEGQWQSEEEYAEEGEEGESEEGLEEENWEENSEESEGGEEGYYDGEGGYSTTPRYAAYHLSGSFLVEKTIGFEQNHYDLTISLIEGEWKLTGASLSVGWK
jgi:hypothetical protein